MLMMLTAVTIVSVLTAPCLGFSLSPPLGACVSMWPHHGVDAQSSDPPYTITVSKSIYNPRDQLTIFVNTTDQNSDIEFFEGLMIQARRARCDVVDYQEAVGSFTLDSNEDFLGLMDCQGGVDSAVVHRAHAHIYNRTFTWTAPSISVGHIYFRGTIVRRKSTFWTTVMSTFIRDASDSSTPMTCYHQTKSQEESACTSSAGNVEISRVAFLLTIVVFWLRI